MEYKDYYKILDLKKSASMEEIKKQYRRLARKFHPDVNPGDVNAASKFAEINEAHEVLSDPEKRKKYDVLGSNWKQYENIDRSSPYSYEKTYGKGESYTVFESDIRDMLRGGFSEFFKTFFGNPDPNFGSRHSKHPLKGQDYRAELVLSIEEAYYGCIKIIIVNNENMRITFQPGLKDGQTIKLKGRGGSGYKKGEKGDLFISIRIPFHPLYRRLDNDLFFEAPVSIYKMLLGGEEEIKVLSGKLKIKIPPESENGSTFRVRGKGFPIYGKPESFGDLYVKISAKMPKNLSEKEKTLIKELSHLRGEKI